VTHTQRNGVASATASAATAATSSAVRGLVDADPTSVELLVVQSLHGRVGVCVIGEADEAKASAATSVAVLDDNGFFDLAELLELLAEGAVVGVPGKASNEQL